MRIEAGRFTVRLAETAADVAAAQRLRYRVFVEEMGARSSPEDTADRRERDKYDPYFEHLLLIDNKADNPDVEEGVVGVYRLMRGQRAAEGIGFYGQDEYDLTKLVNYPRNTVELGRSCVDLDHRGGGGMHLLWTGMSEYLVEHDISIMFGVASFHGTDLEPISQALSYLHHHHLAPEDLRVRAVDGSFVNMAVLPAGEVDKKEAMRQIPALIKAYLRQGGFVGEGAYIDHGFNTVDVCLLMDTARMAERYRAFYSRRRGESANRILG